MEFDVRHLTAYDYEPPASGLALRLRLFPGDSQMQSVRSWSVSVNGEPVEALLTTGFGDREALWFSRAEVDRVEIVAEGCIETHPSSGVVGRVGIAQPGVFLRETELTRPDDAIAALAAERQEAEPLERLHALSAAVGAAMTYRPGTTDHDTTAAEALAQGAGVCQDLAHVFIAAARCMAIPARYVVGYLHDADAPLAETHGWAEAHVEGLGWVGFDPTHLVSPTEAYVRLCSGLDARDAAPLRGSFRAGAAETLSVSVAISEAAAQQQ